jgi:hypothetical protein
MSKYKIKITYNRYNGYQATLYQKWFTIFGFTFWLDEVTARGRVATINYYIGKWKAEFGLTNEDVQNLTGDHFLI